MAARIISVNNQKGGPGKTTTTFHLAREAIRRGLKVLLVDADPQGNLTKSASAEDLSDDTLSLADVLTPRVQEKIREVIVPTVWEGADLVPTVGAALGYVRQELDQIPVAGESRLREALTDLVDDYDLILIDCAPALDKLTINAMVAATDVLIVTQPKLYSVEGLSRLLETIALVKQHYNSALNIAGIVVNLYESATVSARRWVDEIRAAAKEQGIPLLEPLVPKAVVIADAAESGTGLDQWGSSGARAMAKIYSDHFDQIERNK